MSDDKNDSGIKVEEHHIDVRTLHERAQDLIKHLDSRELMYTGFGYHAVQKGKDHLLFFTNIIVGDPATAKNNIVLEYRDGRVSIGVGTWDGTPTFHTLRHREETAEKMLDTILAGSTGKRPSFGYKTAAARSQPKPP